MLGVTGPDINIHKECRVAALLQPHAYICVTGTGEKWKQSSTCVTCKNNLHYMGGDSNLGINAFFLFSIQEVKPAY